MPRLQVLNGKRQGAIFEIEPSVETIIGHRQSALITIDDPWVSWDHARIIYDAESASCRIEDLGSTNGTFVNCVRVKREELRHEDIVFLGKTHVIYLSPAEEHSVALFGDDAFDGPEIPLTPPTPSPVAAPASPLAVSSAAQGLLGDSSVAAGAGALMGSGAKARDPFEDSSIDPFSSDPVREGVSDGGWPAIPQQFTETRPDDVPYTSSTSRRLDLEQFESDPHTHIPAPSTQEISKLIRNESGYDDLDAILGDGRAMSPGPQQVPPRRPPLRQETPPDFDVRNARTLPLPEDSSEEDEILNARTIRVRGDARRPPPTLRLGDDEQLKPKTHPGSPTEDMRQVVSNLQRQVDALRGELARKQAELDAMTEDMIEKEDQIEAMSEEIARLRAAGGAGGSAPRRPQPHLDPAVGEDFRSLEF